MNKKINEDAKLRALSEKIRLLRVSQGLTQKEVAGILNTSSQSVSGYENGNVLPDIGCLYKYADYFKISLSELLESSAKQTVSTDDTPTSSEMQIIEAYRRKPEYTRKAIRLLCFNGTAYRPEEEEMKEMEDFLNEKKAALKTKNLKKK